MSRFVFPGFSSWRFARASPTAGPRLAAGLLPRARALGVGLPGQRPRTTRNKPKSPQAHHQSAVGTIVARPDQRADGRAPRWCFFSGSCRCWSLARTSMPPNPFRRSCARFPHQGQPGFGHQAGAGVAAERVAINFFLFWRTRETIASMPTSMPEALATSSAHTTPAGRFRDVLSREFRPRLGTGGYYVHRKNGAQNSKQGPPLISLA